MAASGDADEVILSGRLQRVGSFRFLLDGHRWEWSDAVARMHGYEPGEVTPTTELLLEHKHPEDRDGVADTLQRVLTDGEPFSSRHRIIDTKGKIHFVVVVGDRLTDEDGKSVGTTGFYVDVTGDRNADLQTSIDETLPEMVEARAAIEQAKGALMLAYGIGADHAFEVLKWCSQESNVKLRTIAEHLVTSLPDAIDLPVKLRDRLDHLLLTTGR
ncbi:ANTAR domain-containing protein [Prescottella agglutinans]|uniref:histidine kinase n=1 Tax=Prescottella agglutinans TaxID=1644129 RepID=A0A438BCW6_9NOCA|nr:PAS and ANTAR domain-containing protein [Prescottella agglutinans]RVW08808.1 ANTAR domain-containing protein [Prescottella agglutinans]